MTGKSLFGEPRFGLTPDVVLGLIGEDGLRKTVVKVLGSAVILDLQKNVKGQLFRSSLSLLGDEMEYYRAGVAYLVRNIVRIVPSGSLTKNDLVYILDVTQVKDTPPYDLVEAEKPKLLMALSDSIVVIGAADHHADEAIHQKVADDYMKGVDSILEKLTQALGMDTK